MRQFKMWDIRRSETGGYSIGWALDTPAIHADGEKPIDLGHRWRAFVEWADANPIPAICMMGEQEIDEIAAKFAVLQKPTWDELL